MRKKAVDAHNTLNAPQIREIKQTGILVSKALNPVKAVLLSQKAIAFPVGNSLAGVVAHILFSMVMLLFLRDLKRGNRFSASLSRYLRINGWVVLAYALVEMALGNWRLQVVETMTNGTYLPLEGMQNIRYAWIFSLMLFLFAAAFNYAHRLEEEQKLTI